MTPPHPLRRHRTRAVAAASDSLNVISAGNYANANVFICLFLSVRLPYTIQITRDVRLEFKEIFDSGIQYMTS